MIFKVMAIRDKAIEAFGQPVFVASVGQAVRSFGDEIKRADANNGMNKHPEDYDLFLLGTYDDQTGTLESVDPEVVAVGKNYL